MMSAVAIKQNVVLTIYLKDRIIKGISLGSDWGKVRFIENTVMAYDGSGAHKSEIEEFDISDIIAIGNTGTHKFIVRNELCWELCGEDAEMRSNAI